MDDETRRVVAARAENRCEYCQSPALFSPGPFCTEHIHPQTLGGSDDLDNLAWSCLGCNGHKAVAITAIDPVSGIIVSLFHPRRDSWLQHFCWSDDTSKVIGLAPTGRATVERLKLNRIEVINLRRVLRAAGYHPPANVT